MFCCGIFAALVLADLYCFQNLDLIFSLFTVMVILASTIRCTAKRTPRNLQSHLILRQRDTWATDNGVLASG